MPPQTHSQLRDGIAAAQAGNKVRARVALRQVVGAEPENEIAWLWLANVAADPTEGLACLRTVLKLNPANTHAKNGLTSVVIRAAVEAAQRKDFPTARGMLGEALAIDPDNEHALLWMAGVAARPGESVRYLRRVLEINPHNERAKQGLAQYPADAEAADEKPTADPPLILVVDDSATVRRLVAAALQDAGYRVTCLADGLQVAEALQTQGVPALALLDVAMPGLDGYQVCRFLREKPETAAVPVIFLAAEDGLLNRLRGKWAGAAGQLAKPFSATDLVQTVGRLLAQK